MRVRVDYRSAESDKSSIIYFANDYFRRACSVHKGISKTRLDCRCDDLFSYYEAPVHLHDELGQSSVERERESVDNEKKCHPAYTA